MIHDRNAIKIKKSVEGKEYIESLLVSKDPNESILVPKAFANTKPQI